MFTLVGYYSTLQTNNEFKYLTPLPDQHVTAEGYNLIVPVGMANLLGAICLGSAGLGCRIETPALRRTLLFDMPYINRSVVPMISPRYSPMFYNPIPLDEREPMRVQVRGTEATPAPYVVLVWLGDGAQASVGGEIYTMRATGSTTLVEYTWTTVSLTLDQVLPAGSYQMVGARALSAGGIAARFIFVGGTWRPGCVAYQEISYNDDPIFRRGGLGVWGEFTHDQPPKVEFLSRSADTSEEVWLDLIKVA